MAEQSKADRKSQLIAELERSRSEWARSIRGVRHDLDVGAHLKHAFVRQKTAWLTGAAITGWVLAKLPSRKKTPKAASARASKLKDKERGGLLLTVLSLAVTLLRPAATAFASRKIAEFASRNGHEPKSRPSYARH